MNKMKRFLLILIALTLALCSPQYVQAKENILSLEPLVQKHIEESKNIIPDGTWSQNTEIESITPTYGTTLEVNGYIVSLKTNNTDSGYVQYQYINGELEVISYTYRGKHKTSDIEDKIIYLGSLNYAYKTDENTYSLVGCEKEKLSLSDLEHLTTVPITIESKTTSGVRSATMIPSFSSSYMVVTSDFSGYNDHCSPTAGTNWVKYWGYCRGKSSLVRNNGASMSNFQIFTRLYTLMKTNVYTDGTRLTDVAPGLSSYCNEHSINLSRAYYSSSALSYNGYKSGINSGNPVLLSLASSLGSSYGDHTIMGVGYVGTTAIIMDGWSRTPVYVTYSSLGVRGCYEVGF